MSAILKSEQEPDTDQGQSGFRAATTYDLDVICEIENRAYPHPWSRGLLKDCLESDYFFYLMVEDDQAIGYGIMSCALDEAHVLNICIDPDQQGQGKGRALMEHLFDVARRQKAHTLFLEVRLSNLIAQQMYENMGFNQISSRRAYYPNGKEREDALIYAKSLH